MNHPTKDVTIESGPLAGQKVTVHGYGTYRGESSHGFITWHDGKNRREPKTTAAVRFEGVKVNGIAYEGRQDLTRAVMDKGETGYMYRVRKGDWEIEYGYGPRRVGGGDPTDKARAAIREAALWAAKHVDETAPEFFRYDAERYALAEEISIRRGTAKGHEHDAAKLRAQADEMEKALHDLERNSLVAAAAEAVEEIDPDELERR